MKIIKLAFKKDNPISQTVEVVLILLLVVSFISIYLIVSPIPPLVTLILILLNILYYILIKLFEVINTLKLDIKQELQKPSTSNIDALN